MTIGGYFLFSQSGKSKISHHLSIEARWISGLMIGFWVVLTVQDLETNEN